MLPASGVPGRHEQTKRGGNAHLISVLRFVCGHMISVLRIFLGKFYFLLIGV